MAGAFKKVVYKSKFSWIKESKETKFKNPLKFKLITIKITNWTWNFIRRLNLPMTKLIYLCLLINSLKNNGYILICFDISLT